MYCNIYYDKSSFRICDGVVMNKFDVFVYQYGYPSLPGVEIGGED